MKVLVFAGLIFVILSAFLFAGASWYLYRAQANGDLQAWASKQLGMKVDFAVVGVHWVHLEPGLYLSKISLTDTQGSQATDFSVDHAEIGFRIWKSIRERTLVTESILLDGLELAVSQKGVIQYEKGSEASQAPKPMPWAEIWNWLKQQRSIRLENSTLFFETPTHTWLFQNVDAEWSIPDKNGYVFRAQANLPQTTHGKVEFGANIASGTDPLQAELYVHLEGDDFTFLFQDLNYQGLQLQKIGGSLALWLKCSTGSCDHVSARVQLHDLELTNSLTHQTASLQSLEGEARWKKLAQGFELQGQLGQQTAWDFRWEQALPLNDPTTAPGNPDNASPLTTLSLQALNVSIDDLAILSPLLDASKAPGLDILQHLKPGGKISAANLKASLDSQNHLTGLLGKMQVQDFKVSPWAAYPGVSGLNANISLEPQTVNVQVSSPVLQVSLPNIFDNPLPFIGLSANLKFSQQADRWRVDISQALLQNDWISGKMQADVTQDPEGTPLIRAQGSLELRHPQDILVDYVPKKPIVDSTLHDWLSQNIVEVPAAASTFVWYGHLNEFPFRQGQGVMNIGVAADRGTVIPWEGWPKIQKVKAQLSFYNASLRISANQGSLVGGVLKDFKLILPDMTPGQNSYIAILAHANVQGAQLPEFVQQSPLKDRLDEVTEALDVQGQLPLVLKMHFPLGDGRRPNVIQGRLSFVDTQLQLRGTPLGVDHLNGVLNFTPDTLRSKHVQGRFLNQDLSVHLQTLGQVDSPVIQADFAGQLSVSELEKKLNFKLSPWVDGQTPFLLRLVLKQSQAKIFLNSSLTGINIHLPAPFAKTAATSRAFLLHAAFKKPDHFPTLIQFKDVGAAKLDLKLQQGQFKLSRGLVSFGSKSIAPDQMPNKGLRINGQLAHLTLGEWLTLFGGLSKGKASDDLGPASLSWLNSVSLKIGVLSAFSEDFPNAQLDLTAGVSPWSLSLSGPKVKGVIQLPSDWNEPSYTLNLDYLMLAEPNLGGQASLKPFSAKKLRDWPGLDIRIHQLYLGPRLLGDVIWQSQPLTLGLNLSQLRLFSDQLELTLQGQVLNNKLTKDDVIHVSAEVKSQNWGDTLSVLGYPNFMKKGQGLLSFKGGWLGNLALPKVETLNGEIQFDLKSGQLTQVNPGVSRFLGLFSISSFLRRLDLNFHDLTDKGLAFDELKGQYHFNKGVGTTQETRLEGPSLNLLLKGQIDLPNQTLDQTVVAMPQVGGGLAVAVGFLGGPIVGAATWLADKVVSSTILKNKGIVYHISGPWSAPVMTNLSEEQGSVS